MKVIAKDHDIIIKGGQKTIKYCADGDYSAANEKDGKKGKIKSLVGSGKVQDTLGKLQGVLGALGGAGSSSQTSTMPPPPPESKGMSTGVKIAIAVGALGLVGLIIYVSKKK